MRVVFMGTPDFSVPALDALIDAGHDILTVYTQPPRPAGRGQAPRQGPVAARAFELGLDLRQPVSFRGSEAQAQFAALEADVGVVVAYGLILPQAILDAPEYGCLNIHASLLPRWRGAAPIHRAIMAGDTETGVGIMQMEAGLDTGPVLLERRTPIGEEETAGELHDRLSEIGASAIVEALHRMARLVATPQNENGATYASKIEKSEARVDWTKPAVEVDRQIRGLSPFPGAWTEIEGDRVKLLRSRLVPGHGTPGTILGGLTIACGEGAVEITLAQRAGRRAMGAGELLRGLALPDVLS